MSLWRKDMQSKGIILIEGTLIEFNREIAMLQKRRVLNSGVLDRDQDSMENDGPHVYWALVRFNGRLCNISKG